MPGLVLAFLLTGMQATGAEPADPRADTLEVPSVESRGASTAAPSGGIHRIEGDALHRFASLEDALASLPGFRVRRQGGLGGYSEMTFRGAPGARIDIYVDGVRLNQDGDAAPDLSKWPSLWFSSLEASTGFDADGAGPGALARIDLSTRSAHRATIRSRGGSFGTAEAAAQTRLRGGDGWLWTLGVEGQTGRNDYPFFSDNGTSANKEDDAVWNMDNNAYRSRGARAAVRKTDGGGAHTLSLLWLESRKEYPGLFPSSSRAYTLRNDWLGAWRLERFGNAVTWETGLQARRLWDSYRDPERTLGTFSHEQARVSWSAEADAAVATAPWATIGLRADARLRAENIDPVATPFSQEMASPAAQRQEARFGGRLNTRPSRLFTVTLEARLAHIRFQADSVRPYPAAPAGVPVSETFSPLALRAALEQETRAGTFGAVIRREPRAPASAEFLGDNNGIRHNPRLLPEEARSASLFHVFARDAWSAQTSLYWNEYDDPIRLAGQGGSPFLRYENGDDYRALGFELAARADASRAEAALSMTLQDASIREGLHKGNRPAYQSALEVHAELFARPAPGVRFGPLLDYRSAYYPDASNIPASRREPEWEWGAHAGIERGPARLDLDARNLSGRQYRDFAHSPRSGRRWSLTLSLNL